MKKHTRLGNTEFEAIAEAYEDQEIELLLIYEGRKWELYVFAMHEGEEYLFCQFNSPYLREITNELRYRYQYVIFEANKVRNEIKENGYSFNCASFVHDPGRG